jgi:hypothetical protein
MRYAVSASSVASLFLAFDLVVAGAGNRNGHSVEGGRFRCVADAISERLFRCVYLRDAGSASGKEEGRDAFDEY